MGWMLVPVLYLSRTIEIERVVTCFRHHRDCKHGAKVSRDRTSWQRVWYDLPTATPRVHRATSLW